MFGVERHPNFLAYILSYLYLYKQYLPFILLVLARFLRLFRPLQ